MPFDSMKSEQHADWAAAQTLQVAAAHDRAPLASVGAAVGAAEGAIVGAAVGVAVGDSVGDGVGAGDTPAFLHPKLSTHCLQTAAP